MEPRSFSAVSAVTQCEPGRFLAEVDPEWGIGGKPNGGYLLSMLGRAATSIGVHPHVTAASAHYLHSPKPGPVLIETELLRAGRSASQIRARMKQDGQPCVEALITASELAADTAPYWDGGLPELSQSRFEDCPRLIPSLPNGNRVAIMEQVEVRLDPDSAGFTAGRPSGGRADGASSTRADGWPSAREFDIVPAGADVGADRLRARRPGPRPSTCCIGSALDAGSRGRVLLRLGHRHWGAGTSPVSPRLVSGCERVLER